MAWALRSCNELYRPQREKTGSMPLAELELIDGETVVLLKLIGLGLDVTTLSFERIR